METATPTTVSGDAVELLSAAGPQVRARVRPDPGHPMYAGHFPGFPITPGVYLVEFIHRVVQAALGDRCEVRLVEIVSCRFRGPAFPGDELVADLTLSRAGADLHCSATVHTGRGLAAEISYRAQVRDLP